MVTPKAMTLSAMATSSRPVGYWDGAARMATALHARGRFQEYPCRVGVGYPGSPVRLLL